MRRPLFAASLLAATALPVALPLALGAQVPAGNSAPQPAAYVDRIPAPQDIPFPGTIQLDVDATNNEQGIFQVRETIPTPRAGHMVLLYPKWVPGGHNPRNEIDKVAGLHFRAGGRELPWTRDPVNVYAFHIDVPEGARQVTAEFQFLSSTRPEQGPVMMSPNILRLQWIATSLYPAGYFSRRIPVQATVRYPSGWTAYSGLPSSSTGSTYTYQRTNYEILVDSPVLAGRYAHSWQLSPRVSLDTVADTPEQLNATPAQIDAHRRLVEQAVRTFGAQHYDNYHFLFSISDQIGGIGLEHHRSSEDGTRPGYFTEWEMQGVARNLLPHEYTHSWDGKFRRGADLWTPNLDVPMRDSLLWVYEGQTQFWGYVLQARSGLVSKQETLDAYAAIAGSYDLAPARQWRPLIDTTNDPIISARRPKGWTSWQRSEDYYNEGLMVWMEVDAMLREQSHGTKSIDDFARAFFGVRDGDWGELTYTFDDVVSTLNAISPYDWAAFLHRRLTETGRPAPVNGFTMNGYRLVYTPEPTLYFRGLERIRGTDASYSIGLVVDKDGIVTQTIWNSPAFRAGFTVGDTLLAINGDTYTGDRLKAAIVAAKNATAPIQLTVRDGQRVRQISIDYHDGPRYPRLQKIGEGETGLDRLLAPR
ncbi:M61 family metallopeptidase [Sphingomonas sp.]|uniref:M61 family metallopeptidase n=1 Tax=Sphingomonas sp. TaxID=28214 RepID=UPI003CC6D04D